MEQQTLKAYAKVNLTLDVIGKLPNGYHEVKMIMQQINLYDEVTISKRKTGIELRTNSGFIPKDNRNIAFKAAQIMVERYDIKSGIQIYIDKRIPISAGLAGGSTDAAAVIKGINLLFKLNLTLDEQMKIGLELGADVPFCIMGGAAIAEGIGEKLTPIKGLKHGWMVLAKPSIGVSTKEVYQKLNWDQIKKHPNTEDMLNAIDKDEIHDVSAQLCNVLEEVTLELYPVVKELKDRFYEYGGLGVLMSGSGPSVFGFFKTYDKAKKAQKKLSRIYNQSYLISTVNN